MSNEAEAGEEEREDEEGGEEIAGKIRPFFFELPFRCWGIFVCVRDSKFGLDCFVARLMQLERLKNLAA